MSKKRSRVSRSSDRSLTTDVVTQLEVAFRNPRAAAIGAVIGGLIPWFGKTLAHGEIQLSWASNRPIAFAMIAVVIGCGAFSGLSVYKFGKAAFHDTRKAIGFVLALEGVMLVSHGAKSAVALVTLVLINAIANGSVIALARDAALRKERAVARGAVTRATKRAATSSPSGMPAHAPRKSPPTAASHALIVQSWHRGIIDAEVVS